MAISNEKATPLLALVLAGIVGYIAYTGAVIEMVGIHGLASRQAHVTAIKDTIVTLEAATDSAKKELARGTVADVRKRLESFWGRFTVPPRLGAGGNARANPLG